MNYTKKLVAAAATVIVGFATSAHAATLASAFIGGAYDVSTDTNTNTSTLTSNGRFGGSFNPANIPTGDAYYTLSVSFDLNGTNVLSESFSEVGTLTDLSSLATLGLFAGQTLANGAGTVNALPNGLGDFQYGFSGIFLDPQTFMGVPVSIAGSYGLTVNTNVPIADIVNNELANFISANQITNPLLTNFSFPSNDSGNFDLSLTLDVQPVPLPAGTVLLLTGVAAFGATRRRKRN